MRANVQLSPQEAADHPWFPSRRFELNLSSRLDIDPWRPLALLVLLVAAASVLWWAVSR